MTSEAGLRARCLVILPLTLVGMVLPLEKRRAKFVEAIRRDPSGPPLVMEDAFTSSKVKTF